VWYPIGLLAVNLHGEQVVELDGLPSGIELAASLVQLLPCEEIAREIESNLGFLQSTRRDMPERHQSLSAVFHHSWNLLSAAEQRVLQQLSVFRGGFSRDAAMQVAGRFVPCVRDAQLVPRGCHG
jgi:predicted ATPase